MLNATQLALLKAELTTDPASLGYASHVALGDDSGTLGLLTDRSKGGTVPQPIEAGRLILWAAMGGVLAGIVAGTNNANAQVASLCLAAKAYLDGGLNSLDLTDPAIVGAGGMLDAMTSAGIFPATGAGSKAGLISFGSAPSSRADVVLGYGIVPTLVDVAVALRGNQ